MNILTIFCFYRGAYRWKDILSRPTTYHREKLKKIEKDINIHDVCNIQFTSVSMKMKIIISDFAFNLQK